MSEAFLEKNICLFFFPRINDGALEMFNVLAAPTKDQRILFFFIESDEKVEYEKVE